VQSIKLKCTYVVVVGFVVVVVAAVSVVICGKFLYMQVSVALFKPANETKQTRTGELM
jgi:hypothetical protein